MEKLKSLEEFNEERAAERQSQLLNGIACPECGKELSDMYPLLASYMKIECLECGYKGRRVI